jgi:Ca2+-transporting ATPase
LLGVLYVSALQPIFKTVALDWHDWILVLIAAGIPTFLMGIGSVLQKPSSRKRMSYRTKTVAR